MSSRVGGSRHEQHEQQAQRHDRKTEAAEQASRMPVGEASRNRCHDHQRGRPRRDQHADLDRRQSADILEVERQCDERDELCGVRADRGRHRQCEDGSPEQVDRQHRRGQCVLAVHEEPADDDADGEFHQHHGHPLATADAVERGDEQAECDGVHHRAQRIERMAGARRLRQKATGQQQRQHTGQTATRTATARTAPT